MNTRTLVTQIRPIATSMLRVQWAKESSTYHEMDFSVDYPTHSFVKHVYDNKVKAGEVNNSLAASTAKYTSAMTYFFRDKSAEMEKRAVIFVVVEKDSNNDEQAHAFSVELNEWQFRQMLDAATDGGALGRIVAPGVEDKIVLYAEEQFKKLGENK